MGKIIISLVVAAIITIMLRGTFIPDFKSLCMTAGLTALVYYVCFIELGKMDEIEILEEHKREPEDPEEILP